jgi:hypothetical protein
MNNMTKLRPFLVSELMFEKGICMKQREKIKLSNRVRHRLIRNLTLLTGEENNQDKNINEAYDIEI